MDMWSSVGDNEFMECQTQRKERELIEYGGSLEQTDKKTSYHDQREEGERGARIRT